MATNLEAVANGLRRYGDEHLAESYAWDEFVRETDSSGQCDGCRDTTDCDRCFDKWCRETYRED